MHPFCCVSIVSNHSTSARSEPRETGSVSQRSNRLIQTNRHHDLDPNGVNRSHIRDGDLSRSCIHQSGASRPSRTRFSDQNGDLCHDYEDDRGLSFSHRNGADRKRTNDIVRISGILYKWMNYGRGWRRRWFMLQDGVLSYYKIHGPDKIFISSETVRGSRVIGEESLRILSGDNNSSKKKHRNNANILRGKASGEIHLKVSSIHQSRSDVKRFLIFTGTKRLHLCAETNKDRAAWVEALHEFKNMFPRMSNTELMAPTENLTVSTENLRQRLIMEGLSEATIHDTEQVMRDEFAALQNELELLKRKQYSLVDKLRNLEVNPRKL